MSDCCERPGRGRHSYGGGVPVRKRKGKFLSGSGDCQFLKTVPVRRVRQETGIVVIVRALALDWNMHIKRYYASVNWNTSSLGKPSLVEVILWVRVSQRTSPLVITRTKNSREEAEARDSVCSAELRTHRQGHVPLYLPRVFVFLPFRI